MGAKDRRKMIQDLLTKIEDLSADLTAIQEDFQCTLDAWEGTNLEHTEKYSNTEEKVQEIEEVESNIEELKSSIENLVE
jgi:peptidoglycan hydrolase CwlO-like protein